MHRKYTCIVAVVILSVLLVSGQNRASAQVSSELKFSEILVVNESNCIDDYGCHSPWIEIFNDSNNPVDIGGCFLTNDLANPSMCWIPSGDQKTIIGPKSFLILWADNKPERGIFHLNIDLKNANTLALFNADGNKLIDKIDLPQPPKTDVTYGRLDFQNADCQFLDKSTPGTINHLARKETIRPQSEKVDMSGVTNFAKFIAVAFAIVIIFIIIRKILGRKNNLETVDGNSPENNKMESSLTYQEVPDEVNAAIAMALFLYQNDLHDHENTVLTLQKVSRTYSPWSSKIYTLRKLPR